MDVLPRCDTSVAITIHFVVFSPFFGKILHDATNSAGHNKSALLAKLMSLGLALMDRYNAL